MNRELDGYSSVKKVFMGNFSFVLRISHELCCVKTPRLGGFMSIYVYKNITTRFTEYHNDPSLWVRPGAGKENQNIVLDLDTPLLLSFQYS